MSTTDNPWTGDACSLVDAFRSKERSPLEELQASLHAIEKSSLNAFSFVDPEGATQRAKSADVSKPFGGFHLELKNSMPCKGGPTQRRAWSLQIARLHTHRSWFSVPRKLAERMQLVCALQVSSAA